MTNKEAERKLRAAGFYLVRNGKKHAIWSDGKVKRTVAHGKMSFGAIRELNKLLEKGK